MSDTSSLGTSRPMTDDEMRAAGIPVPGERVPTPPVPAGAHSRVGSDLRLRFGTAAGGPAPTMEQRQATAALQEKVIALAAEIEASVPPGRNRSTALTALEDVQMRANRGIYNRDEATR